jgi:hypothetical protein
MAAITLLDLLDEAIDNPELVRLWAADPLGTARAAGVELSTEDLKRMLGIAGATDAELIEVLRVRLRHTPPCCPCTGYPTKCNVNP